MEAISVNWAGVKESTVACFFFRTVCFVIGVDWWINDELVVVVNDVFHVAHDTVTFFTVLQLEICEVGVLCGEVFIY